MSTSEEMKSEPMAAGWPWAQKEIDDWNRWNERYQAEQQIARVIRFYRGKIMAENHERRLPMSAHVDAEQPPVYEYVAVNPWEHIKLSSDPPSIMFRESESSWRGVVLTTTDLRQLADVCNELADMIEGSER